MRPAPRCLAGGGRHAVQGQESARLCAAVALSSATRFRRRSAKSVARSPEPDFKRFPCLEYRKRRVRVGHTEKAPRKRDLPARCGLADRERRSLAGYFVSASLNRWFVCSDQLPGGDAH